MKLSSSVIRASQPNTPEDLEEISKLRTLGELPVNKERLARYLQDHLETKLSSEDLEVVFLAMGIEMDGVLHQETRKQA